MSMGVPLAYRRLMGKMKNLLVRDRCFFPFIQIVNYSLLIFKGGHCPPYWEVNLETSN